MRWAIATMMRLTQAGQPQVRPRVELVATDVWQFGSAPEIYFCRQAMAVDQEGNVQWPETLDANADMPGLETAVQRHATHYHAGCKWNVRGMGNICPVDGTGNMMRHRMHQPLLV
jgi:hypothetical protein